MSDSSRSPLPPVRLHTEAELARDALSTPLLSRAVRLARWAGPATLVDAGGGLVPEQVPAAVELLGLTGDDAAALACEAWQVAVDAGLVEIADEEAGTVIAGEELALLTGGAPHDVLAVWLTALDTVIADAAVPDLDHLMDAMDATGEVDFSQLDWDPEGEAEFLDGVLGNLYLLTASEEGPGDGPVPLPALAASMIVPGDMGEPTNDMLEQVSDAMMRLDDQFRLLEPIGLVAYQPVDEALMADPDGAVTAAPDAAPDDLVTAAPDAAPTTAPDHARTAAPDHALTTAPDRVPAPAPHDAPMVATPEDPPAAPLLDETDVSRYGMVRLTPLGLYGLRARLLEAGFAAPAVGELSDKGADALLDGSAEYAPRAARAETERWLARREPLAAARELLSAARGSDPGAPLRRLRCQQALSLVGVSAEPAVREVLDDPELGGLARVWLTELGRTDVPAPSQDLVFWLTIDTLAAQLAAEGNSEELQALVEGLAQQHSGFFAAAWRVEHPATPDVLEAMGRLHPDKRVAKEARKAAFKARSQKGG